MKARVGRLMLGTLDLISGLSLQPGNKVGKAPVVPPISYLRTNCGKGNVNIRVSFQ